jgi:predicted GNAT superfamily acetyltransferase
MMRTLDGAQIAARASDQAETAAERAAVEIASVDDPREIREVSALFDEVWGTDADSAILPAGVLRALAHAGNYAAAAYRDGEMVGAVVGFLGLDAWGPYLHSHILGVSARSRGANVGFALKLHQRAWALRASIRKVTWTFDPLVRRNAYFNLQKLGARAGHYYEDFYGAMSDGINAGDESDRVLIVWDLDDERAERAGDRDLAEPASDCSDVALAEGGGGEPVVADVGGRTVVCATPADIVAMRRTDPGLALRWRRALRETLGRYMSDGYSVSGFTRSGLYVLDRDGHPHA